VSAVTGRELGLLKAENPRAAAALAGAKAVEEVLSHPLLELVAHAR